MAYTPLKVSIADPCHEEWTGMAPVSGSTARHCDSCEKNVVDFTGMTDAQLHDYVRNNGGKICGRLRPDQLERPLRAVSTPSRNPLKVAATAASLMIASAGLDAQTAPPPPPVPTEQTQTEPEIMGEIEPMELPENIMGAISIKIDSTPPPPPGPACAPDPMIMGRMTVSPPVPTGMDWVRDTLKNVLTPAPPPPEKPSLHPRPRPEAPKYLDEVKVFPNPFLDRIVLETTRPNPDELTVELIDATGRVLLTEPWRTETGYNNLVLRPTAASLTGGAYFLRVTDQTGRTRSRTLVHR